MILALPSMTICNRRQSSSTRRVYSSTAMKKKITKSKSKSSSVNDVRKVRRARPAEKRDSRTCKLEDDDDRIQPPPPVPVAAAESRRKIVEVERLGGLKLRFRFSWIDIHSSNSSGDHIPPPVTTFVKTNKLAVQETISRTTDDHDERNRCTMRSWRQMKLQREREASRRKIESITKTVDISNNYYDTMTQLDRMFGDSEWVMEAFYGARNQKPLEKLGLFLKV